MLFGFIISKKAACFTLSWSGAGLFSHLIRDSSPPLCCQGSARAAPLFAWYRCSLAAGDRHRLARISPPLCFCVLMCHSSRPFEVGACKSAADTSGHRGRRTIRLLGLQKSSRDRSRDGAAVAIVTGRSNLQSLRVLIESLHSMRGGEWTTTGAGIERTETDRRNHVNLCVLSESLPT